MSLDDPLNAEAIRAALSTGLIGRRVLLLEETTSTNDALAAAASLHEEGVVVFAERQTAGRGQYGRRWESAPDKGLWLSVLLRPELPVAESSRLTDLLAAAVAESIQQQLGIATRIKPPNDVYIEGRKVAGVLVEMRVEPGRGHLAVAGVGINVNHSRQDFPPELCDTAISLSLACGKMIDRTAFAISFLQLVDQRYAALRKTTPGVATPQPS